MDVKQIIEAETIGARAVRGARVWVEDGPTRDALSRVETMLNEWRHFAVTWDDIRKMEDTKTIDAEQAKNTRQAAIQRLVTYCAPDRL